MRNTFWSFLLLLSFACARRTQVDPAPVNNTVNVPDKPVDPVRDTLKMSKIKYLALGDSYTYGQSVDADKRFPEQLVQELILKGFEKDTLQLIARTGWTTDELQKAINKQSPDTTFDLVTLLIGVNNKFRGYDINKYKEEFESLLKQAIRFAKGDKSRVFVVSIPDYGYTPFGQSNQVNISAGIDLFNAANKAITESYGITYFDITPISRQGFEQPDLVADDHLHPSARMYNLWVRLMLPAIEERLKK